MAFDPKTLGTDILSKGKSLALDAVDESGIGKLLRSTNLPTGAEPASGGFVSGSWDDEEERVDWRVRLSIPSGLAQRTLSDAPIVTNPGAPGGESGERGLSSIKSDPLDPLYETRGMVFPYTPNIYITYSANYDNLHPTHSNYPFPIYQNSAVDQFVITGEFTVENAREGAYWIAANQYLRTVTKMEYGGDSANTGAPPPVVKLDGYGDFVFRDVPVVVQQYNVELSDAVDYIKVPISQNGSWAPTRSTISVTLQPAYSRNSVNQFSLQKFAKGEYLNNGPGFI